MARISWGQHPTRKLLHTLLSLNFIAKDDSPKTENLLTFVVVGKLLFFTISRCSHELIEHCSHLVMSRHFTAHFLTLSNRFRCNLTLPIKIYFYIDSFEKFTPQITVRPGWVGKPFDFEKIETHSFDRYRKIEEQNRKNIGTLQLLNRIFLQSHF